MLFVKKSTDPQFKDETGKRFHRLMVLGYAGDGFWWCQCDCGAITKPFGAKLRAGTTKSCGCHREDFKRKSKTHGDSHAGRVTAEYRLWVSMRRRCSDQKEHNYPNYGGRGIQVCPRWQVYENFLEDMGRRPSPHHQLDRWPNNDGNYEPGNVRWATRSQQCRNTRRNKLVPVDGLMLPLVEACERLGLNYPNIRSRMQKGFTWDRAIAQPYRRSRT